MIGYAVLGGFERRNFNMNKAELVSAMAEKTALSKKDAEAALKAFTDIVAEELKKGEKIQLVGFGTFEVTMRRGIFWRFTDFGGTEGGLCPFFLPPDERISCAHSSNKRKPANKSTEKCDILFKMWFCFK